MANSALFWNETASWGCVNVSPFQSQVKFRFGTTQTGNLPAYSRPVSAGANFTLTTAMKNAGTDSMYINGALALSQGGKLTALAGISPVGNVGRGYNDNSYFGGKIAEVIVYTRALSDTERQQVEGYLRGKYALY